MAKSESTPSRAENVLAFMVAGVIGVSLLTMLVALLTRLFGANPWPILTQIPLIGLPFGFILIMILLFLSIRRRARDNRQ